MRTTRRHILALIGGSLLSKSPAASLPGVSGRPAFDVDRLFSKRGGNADYRLEVRRYVANANVTLFSVPILSKSSVGSAFAVVEQRVEQNVEQITEHGERNADRTISIQFGAGSYPESAHGLNRLGFIHEAILEEKPGSPSECAWLAFVTTSQEKKVEQAKRSLNTHNAMVPYSASQGYGWKGAFASRVERLEFAGRYTWRQVNQLVEYARAAMGAGVVKEGSTKEGLTKKDFAAEGMAVEEVIAEHPRIDQAATFLYMVRRALLDERSHTTGLLVFNRKQFRLDCQKEKDPAATNWFSAKRLLKHSGDVMGLNATLTEKGTGEKTLFRLRYEAGGEQTFSKLRRRTFERNSPALLLAERFHPAVSNRSFTS